MDVYKQLQQINQFWTSHFQLRYSEKIIFFLNIYQLHKEKIIYKELK